MCKWKEVLDFRTNLKAARPDDILHITIHVHNSYNRTFKVKTYKKRQITECFTIWVDQHFVNYSLEENEVAMLFELEQRKCSRG